MQWRTQFSSSRIPVHNSIGCKNFLLVYDQFQRYSLHQKEQCISKSLTPVCAFRWFELQFQSISNISTLMIWQQNVLFSQFTKTISSGKIDLSWMNIASGHHASSQHLHKTCLVLTCFMFECASEKTSSLFFFIQIT